MIGTGMVYSIHHSPKFSQFFFEFKQQNAEMISRKSQVSSVAWDDDSFKPLGASLRV